jgi:hypothetical protein
MGIAVSLQILVTFPVGTAGLRVAAADLLIGPIFLGMAMLSWSHGVVVPSLASRRTVLLCFALLTCVITLALIHGRLNIGEWRPWPLINRWIGWWVLLAYFAVGAWMRTLCEERLIDQAIKVLLVFSWITVAYSAVLYEIFLMGTAELNYPRLSGFFDNPNAYGCALAVLIMLQLSHMRVEKLFSWRVHALGLSLLLLGLILSGSRSAWIGAAAGSLLLFAVHQIRMRDAMVTACGAVLLLVTVYGIASINIATSAETGELLARMHDAAESARSRVYIVRDYDDSGIAHRVKLNKKAMEYWGDSPVIGIGLGAFYERVKTEGQIAPPATLHTTALWLLTETGIVGLAAFVGVFAVLLTVLIGTARSRAPGTSPIEIGVAAGILVVAVASVGTDLLYQRHIWWLAGLALAQPLRTSSPTHPPTAL